MGAQRIRPLPELVDTEEKLRLDRRRVIVCAACVALGATLPGSARAGGLLKTGVRSAAQGLMQSPIDFRESDITFIERLPRIRFAYPRRVDVNLVNTGSPEEFKTVRADILPPDAPYISLSRVDWDLLQFHWHTPSEHEIEGEKTPLEMHLVHRRADTGALLVLGVFMERGENNRALDPMFRELPDEEGKEREVSGVRLRALLPDERESFRYSGSLTTPEFDEGVTWIVFAESISISRRQIRAFQKLFPDGNSREVQPLHGRRILSDAEHVSDDED
jgi:carbonic anhydrase